MTMITPRERLLQAAVEAFSEKGFTATTTRDIANRAGMSPAAVYVHHDTKESLLFTVSVEGHQAALTVIRTAAAVEGGHVERLRHMVREFSTWHAVNSRVGRIVQYELRGLENDRFREVAGLRRRFEELIVRELRAGVEAGEFTVEDIESTGVAILSLGIDVARWYGAMSDQMSAEDVGELHRTLVMRMLGAASF